MNTSRALTRAVAVIVAATATVLGLVAGPTAQASADVTPDRHGRHHPGLVHALVAQCDARAERTASGAVRVADVRGRRHLRHPAGQHRVHPLQRVQLLPGHRCGLGLGTPGERPGERHRALAGLLGRLPGWQLLRGGRGGGQQPRRGRHDHRGGAHRLQAQRQRPRVHRRLRARLRCSSAARSPGSTRRRGPSSPVSTRRPAGPTATPWSPSPASTPTRPSTWTTRN